LGGLSFKGYHTSFQNAASILAYVDGTPGGTTDMPGRLVFSTSPDGSSTLAERMRINSSGNVGIGTTSFTNALAVEKAIANDYVAEFHNDHATAGQSYGVRIHAGTNSSDGAFDVADQTNSSSYFSVRGDGQVTMPSGNVGIGMSDPSYLLEVAGEADNNWIAQIQNTEATDGRNYGFRVRGGSTSADRAFAVEDHDGTNTLFTISGDANVGIGTSVPDNTLHVFKASAGSVTGVSDAPLVIEKDGNAYINILTPDDTDSGIMFGRGSDNNHAGMFYGSDEQLYFNTNNTGPHLTIDSSGNVGIGTAPENLLHVFKASSGATIPSEAYITVENSANTQIFLGSGTTSFGGLLFGDSDSNAMGWIRYDHNVDDMYFGTNGATAMRIDDSGKVGIGTASPAAGLDIAHATAEVGLRVYNSYATDPYGFLVDNTGANSSDANYVADFRVGGTSVMRIENSGNVGIGEASPQSILHITNANSSGAAFDAAARIIIEEGNTNSYIQFAAPSGGTAVQGILFGDADADVGKIEYSHLDNALIYTTNAAEAMRIDSGGNVGIGESSPGTDLDIKGSGAQITHNNGSAGMSVFNIWENNGNGIFSMGYEGGDGVFKISADAGVTGNDFVMDTSGNVGIGTASPNGLFHIEHATGANMFRLERTDTANKAWGFNLDSAFFNVFYDASENYSAASSKLTIDQSGGVYIGDSANADMTVGLTINQGTNDDHIVVLKAAAMGHAMTNNFETDTYGAMSKISPTLGGLHITGITESQRAVGITAAATTEDATRTTGAVAHFLVQASTDNGTNNWSTVTADRNIVVFRNHGSATHIFDSDGDSHQDVGTAWTNFDNEIDVVITRSLGMVMDKASIVKTKWDDWGRDHKEDLERTGIIPVLTQEQKDNGEHALVNTSQVMRLHNGALWQLYTQIMDMAERIEDNVPALRGKLLPEAV